MAQQFTKKEAIALFGQTVRFKKTIFLEGNGIKIPLVKSGTVAEISLIEKQLEGIYVVVPVNDDFTHLDKEGFENYCQLVKPEIIAHARSV